MDSDRNVSMKPSYWLAVYTMVVFQSFESRERGERESDRESAEELKPAGFSNHAKKKIPIATSTT